MPNRAVFLCRCRSVTFEEADNRLVAGWHVELPETDVLASAQRKRYLRLERKRFHVAPPVLQNDCCTGATAPDGRVKSNLHRLCPCQRIGIPLFF